MKLYYVEHSVSTKARYAIIARDEVHLKELLAERAAAFEGTKFKSKVEKTSFDLNTDWEQFNNILWKDGL